MRQKNNSGPLRAAIIYLVFGALWILISDTTLGRMIDSTSQSYLLAQTLKGWFFVLVGASFLYLILKANAKALQKQEGESQESQARFRTLVERMPAITYITPADDLSSIQYISPQIETTLGFSPLEFKSNPQLWAQQVHPEDRERALHAIHESQKNNNPFIYEYRMIGKDGRVIWVKDQANLVQSASGEPLFFEGFMLDITEQKQAEAALRMSEENYRNLSETSDSAIAVLDENGRILYANPTSLRIWRDPNLVGKTVQGLFPKAVAEKYVAVIQRVIQDHIIDMNELETQINGETRWFQVTLSPLKNSDSSVNALLLNAFDLTERKKAEIAQRQSEILFFKIFRSSSIGIHLFRLTDGRSYNANDAFLEIIGYAREELIGHTAAELNLFVNGEARPAWIKPLQEGRSTRNQDIKIRHKSGEIRDCLASLDLIDINGEKMALVVATDITERKKAEEKLRSSEERFRLMAENIEEGFWITDPVNGREVYLSPGMERVYGQSITDLMQKPFAFIETVLPEDIPLVLTNIERQKISEPTMMEYRIKRPDGTLRWVWDRAFPILNSDQTLKFVTGLATDITERKEIDARIQTQLKRLSALNSIDRAISSSMGLNVSLDVLLIEVIAQLGVDSASILLLNEASQTLEFVTGKGFHTSAIKHSNVSLGVGLAGLVGAERKVIHVPNLPELGDGFKRRKLLKDEQFLEYFGVPLVAKGQLKGVLEIFNREALTPDPEWLNYLETLGGQAAIAIENAQLFEGLQKSNQELFMAYDATITGWSHAMDLRDKETEGHTRRVTELTVKLAERMGISQPELVHVRRGALLHDIGKLGVPDHILLKPGKLTDEEWVIMRMHPVYARDMLMPIHYLRPALDIPYCHHEKWDGTGYPRGLKGEEIPLAARLFAVVDVWDALRSDRPYRAGWSAQKTREYILEESGKHFEPSVVESFMELLKELPDLSP